MTVVILKNRFVKVLSNTNIECFENYLVMMVLLLRVLLSIRFSVRSGKLKYYCYYWKVTNLTRLKTGIFLSSSFTRTHETRQNKEVSYFRRTDRSGSGTIGNSSRTDLNSSWFFYYRTIFPLFFFFLFILKPLKVRLLADFFILKKFFN